MEDESVPPDLNIRLLEGKKDYFAWEKEEKKKGGKKKRPTAPAVPRWSPIQVLGRPDAA